MAAPYFPLFVNLAGKRVTIIGGGDTACRKAKLLLRFGTAVCIVAPQISDELAELVREGTVQWRQLEFSPDLLSETDLLVAATNVRAVNHAVYQAAREQRILVNVCDSRAESSFLFPTVVQNDAVVAGVVTMDDNLASAKRLAKKIMEKFAALR